MPAQELSSESKSFLTSLVLNRMVTVQLLSRDQYSRAVSAGMFQCSCIIFIMKHVGCYGLCEEATIFPTQECIC